MKAPYSLLLSVLAISALIPWAVSAHDHTHDGLLKCLSLQSSDEISEIIYTPKNSSYMSILLSSSQNPRIISSSPPKPLLIVTPFHESQIQAVILCSKKHGVQIRVRSGGHDYEGLSYVSQVPFLIIDLTNLRSISVDAEDKTAWVEAGATLGELYYAVAKKSNSLGVVAGLCPTVGVGGHIGGGGWGMISRKYGLASDNIIDAKIIDVNGKVLDRESMGEDLFWALKGAGSAGFGIVTAWKIKLVDVPQNVTVSMVIRTSEQNATQLVHRWQYVTSKMDKNLLVGIFIQSAKSSETGKRSIYASFITMFLGEVNKLVSLMQNYFPELGMVKEDCIQMSWIESIIFFYFGDHHLPLEILLNRTLDLKPYFKAKSDFVQQPIPENGIQGILDWLHKEDENMGWYQFMPLGGRFDEISESETPFPHRIGNIYMINKLINWDEKGNANSATHIEWIQSLHSYMTPYVSKNPRGAYYNFRDLDLGVNEEGNTSYKQASIWGFEYFKDNFKRLAQVKTMVDPDNFFRNEQSIPPLLSSQLCWRMQTKPELSLGKMEKQSIWYT